jgi:hypothetical protein
MLELGKHLGLQFQNSKVEGPTTSNEFLGMEARLSPRKLEDLREMMTQWSTLSHCTLRELERLTGYLQQFCSQVIPLSRAFIRALYDFQSTFSSPLSRRRIPKEARDDISWWSNVVIPWNGVHFISPSKEIIHVYTDASGTKGIGGVLGDQWFARKTPRRLRDRYIQVKEMYAVLYSVLCWGEQFTGEHLVFHIDNEAVFNSLNNLTIRSPDTMHLDRQFLQFACILDFSSSSLWLSSSENSIADAASRFSLARMFSLAPNLRPPRDASTLVV